MDHCSRFLLDSLLHKAIWTLLSFLKLYYRIWKNISFLGLKNNQDHILNAWSFVSSARKLYAFSNRVLDTTFLDDTVNGNCSQCSGTCPFPSFSPPPPASFIFNPNRDPPWLSCHHPLERLELMNNFSLSLKIQLPNPSPPSPPSCKTT